jgi:hypothetical protein
MITSNKIENSQLSSVQSFIDTNLSYQNGLNFINESFYTSTYIFSAHKNSNFNCISMSPYSTTTNETQLHVIPKSLKRCNKRYGNSTKYVCVYTECIRYTQFTGANNMICVFTKCIFEI